MLRCHVFSTIRTTFTSRHVTAFNLRRFSSLPSSSASSHISNAPTPTPGISVRQSRAHALLTSCNVPVIETSKSAHNWPTHWNERDEWLELDEHDCVMVCSGIIIDRCRIHLHPHTSFTARLIVLLIINFNIVIAHSSIIATCVTAGLAAVVACSRWSVVRRSA